MVQQSLLPCWLVHMPPGTLGAPAEQLLLNCIPRQLLLHALPPARMMAPRTCAGQRLRCRLVEGELPDAEGRLIQQLDAVLPAVARRHRHQRRQQLRAACRAGWPLGGGGARRACIWWAVVFFVL